MAIRKAVIITANMNKKKFNQYLKENKSKGHSLSYLREWSLKVGLDKKFVDNGIKSYQINERLKLVAPVLVLLLAIGCFIYNPSII